MALLSGRITYEQHPDAYITLGAAAEMLRRLSDPGPDEGRGRLLYYLNAGIIPGFRLAMHPGKSGSMKVSYTGMPGATRWDGDEIDWRESLIDPAALGPPPADYLPGELLHVRVLRTDIEELAKELTDRRTEGVPVLGAFKLVPIEGESEMPAAAPERLPPVSLRGQLAARRAELQAWYESRVEGWPGGEALPSLEGDWKAATARFPSYRIPRWAIEDLRRALAPAAWKRAGRRRTK